ncbi:MAG: twin-arginine translocation signal domain-containing protein, partial [Patescibacteria group bacterium]|nr:twin-arginine translocation signal domain-containing protein [Patescibacteria group bacterium]
MAGRAATKGFEGEEKYEQYQAQNRRDFLKTLGLALAGAATGTTRTGMKFSKLRQDGTQKGMGWLGALKRPDGGVATEYIIGVNIDGRDIEIPTLVPTLSKSEIDWILNAKDSDTIPQPITDKAVDHAVAQLKKGESPFFGESAAGTSTRYSVGQKSRKDIYSDEEIAKHAPLKSRFYNLTHKGSEGFIARFLTPFSTRLEKINPQLKAVFRKFRSDLNQVTLKDHDAVLPLLQAIKKKMPWADKVRFDLARKNADGRMLQKLIVKYDIGKEYSALRKTLDDIYDRLIEVGYDIDYRRHMHPRAIKDPSGFLQHVYGMKEWGQISEAIKAEQTKRGNEHPLSDTDRAQIADNVLRGFGGQRINLSAFGSMLERKVDIIDSELNQFYHDSDEALLMYITNMNKAIESRKFFGMQKASAGAGKEYRKTMRDFMEEQQADREFEDTAIKERFEEYKKSIIGKSQEERDALEKEYLDDRQKEMEQFRNKQKKDFKVKKAELRKQLKVAIVEGSVPNDDADVDKSVGDYVQKLIDEKAIDEKQQNELIGLFRTFFNYRSTAGAMDFFKSFGYMTTLGNISAAITQITDMAFSFYNAGVGNTLTAFGQVVTGKSKYTKRMIGIERIAEEFSNPTKMSEALNWLFQKTGFARMDRLGKETLINASMMKYERMAKTNPSKFRKIIENMVPSNLVEETIAD